MARFAKKLSIAPEPEEPSAEVMTITPTLATTWLNRNENNRPVRNLRVATYAREMKAGRWRLNGDSIRFDRDGNLLDGQHRLFACIEAGVSFPALVVTGLEPDTFTSIDVGIRRTGADALSVVGEVDTNKLAAALVRVWKWERGLLGSSSKYDYPTHAQIIETRDNHPAVQESIRFVEKQIKGIRISRSALGALHYLFAMRAPELADDFFQALGTGAGLTATSPILHLRNRLFSNYTSATKLPERDILALTIVAWNAVRESRAMKLLRWNATRQGFPEIL